MSQTPRLDKELGQKQRMGNDWFSHDTREADSRPDTPRSGRGQGAFSKKYAGESDKWYTYDKSPTKSAEGAGDAAEADQSVSQHEVAFVEDSAAAPAEIPPAAEPAAPEPVVLEQPAEESAAGTPSEPVPKLELGGDESTSPKEVAPVHSPSKSARADAQSYKERGHGMSEDWYNYPPSYRAARENGPVKDDVDVKSLKTQTHVQAQAFKNRNKGSASDWYKHSSSSEASPDVSPKKEMVTSPSKDQVDLSKKENVRAYAAKAKQGSAGSWFGHVGGEFEPRGDNTPGRGQPRVTSEGRSNAERNKGSLTLFGQNGGPGEPAHMSSRGAAPQQKYNDSMGSLLRMDKK